MEQKLPLGDSRKRRLFLTGYNSREEELVWPPATKSRIWVTLRCFKMLIIKLFAHYWSFFCWNQLVKNWIKPRILFTTTTLVDWFEKQYVNKEYDKDSCWRSHHLTLDFVDDKNVNVSLSINNEKALQKCGCQRNGLLFYWLPCYW